MASTTMNAYTQALEIWDVLYTSTNPINWVIMGDQDYDCWKSYAAQLEGQYSDLLVWNPSSNELGHCLINQNSFCGYGTGVSPSGTFVQFTLIGSNYKVAPAPAVVNHEAVHLYQMSMEADHVKTRRTDTLPPWFIEGQANLFGIDIAFKGDPSIYRDQEVGRLEEIIPGARHMNKQEWLETLQHLSQDPSYTFQNRLGYSIGWFALEYMYQNYSIEQMHQVLLDCDLGLSWSDAITKELGSSWVSINDAIAQYLSQSLN